MTPCSRPLPTRSFSTFADELRYELVVNLVEQIQPFDRQARLAAIEEAADRCGARRLVDIGVVANDHRIAAAELERDPLHVLRRNLHDMFSGGGRTGETDLANPWILQQSFRRQSLAGPGTILSTPGGRPASFRM